MKVISAITKAFERSEPVIELSGAQGHIDVRDVNRLLIRNAGSLCEDRPEEILGICRRLENKTLEKRSYATSELHVVAIGADHIHDMADMERNENKKKHYRKILAISVASVPAKLGLGPEHDMSIVVKDVTDAYYEAKS